MELACWSSWSSYPPFSLGEKVSCPSQRMLKLRTDRGSQGIVLSCVALALASAHVWVSAPFQHALQACLPLPLLPGGTESSSWGPKGHGPNLQRMISEEAFDLASRP